MQGDLCIVPKVSVAVSETFFYLLGVIWLLSPVLNVPHPRARLLFHPQFCSSSCSFWNDFLELKIEPRIRYELLLVLSGNFQK